MTNVGLLVLAVVLLVSSGARGNTGPTLHSCEISAAALEPSEFVLRALGGDLGCTQKTDKTACCSQIQGVFSEGGAAELCMCNKEFFSTLVSGISFRNKVSSDAYVDMLVECGIPVAGRSSCPGEDTDGAVEPVVQSQVFTAKILQRLLSQGATPPPSPPEPAPAPPPAKPAVQTPKFGGKKGAPIQKVVPAKKSVAMATPQSFAPGPMIVIPAAIPAAPAPFQVPTPVAAPVPAPAPAPLPVPAPAPVPVPAPVVAPPAFSGSFIGGSK